MNKKFLSAILFGALALASTGSFVSCKDYDDDIKNLQTQIETLATKSDVEAKLSQLQNALSSAQSAAEAAKSEAANALKEAQNALAAAKAADNSAEIAKLEKEIAGLEDSIKASDKKIADIEAAQAKVAEAIEAVKAEVAGQLSDFDKKTQALLDEAEKKTEEAIGKVGAMVTEVSLVEAYSTVGSQGNGLVKGEVLSLGFKAVSEQTTVFGKGLPGEIKFEAGKSHSLQTSNIVVRVNPANATFTKDEVMLLNSKGEVLDLVEVKEVKPYDKLMTRATTNSGLWNITVQLKENVSMDDLTKATKDKKKDVLFAVAIGNAERSVVSTYDVVAAPGKYAPSEILDFYATNSQDEYVSIKKIRNRFEWTETGEYTFKDEYVWSKKNDKSVVPATLENIVKETEGELYQNVQNHDYSDYRQGEAILAAEVNKPIDIFVNYNEATKKLAEDGEIAGFYVELDTRNALESAPSEINAWKSYSYEGLNKVFAGNTGSITVKSASANGDVIGFRVHAVNLDGTLLDPDGRAFYVYVGDAAKIGTVPTQPILAVQQENSETKTDFLADFKTALAGVDDSYTVKGWTNTKKPEIKDKDGNDVEIAGSLFEVWVKKDKEEVFTKVTDGNIKSIDFSKVKEVKYVMPEAQDFVDGGQYEQQMKVYKTEKGTEVLVKTITVSFVKEMPSEAPVVKYITAQTGELMLASRPNPTTLAHYGTPFPIVYWAGINLNNVYYELSRATAGSILLTADNSLWDADKETYSENYQTYNYSTSTSIYVDNYNDDAFKAITDGSEHTLKFAGFYAGVSYKLNSKGDAMEKGNFTTTKTTDFKVTYNCWHKFTTFDWNKFNYKYYDALTGEFTISGDAKEDTKTFAPELQWTTAGTIIKWNAMVIKGVNTKNPEIFNTTLNEYIAGNVIKAAADDIYLEDVVDPTQKNNYFTPSISGEVINFTTTQNSVNPSADVKQVLKVKATDAFGHEFTITLGEVTILQQKQK